MPTYSVFPIESPVSPFQLTSYKTLRLTSLQIDPRAFSSNYARELAFSEDVWRERLDAPFKQTLVASVRNASHDSEEGDVDNTEAGEKGELIGMAGIVAPSGLPPSALAPFKEVGVGANWEIYVMYGMWVHPTHRGKGVGTQLVQACLAWARINVDTKFLSEKSETCEKVVVLLVYDNNVAGRALYSKIGFTDLEGVSAREGEKWMLARV